MTSTSDFGFVYKWTNKINGKWYVGSHAGSPDDDYVGSGVIFKTALLKYGKENFFRDILYTGPFFREEEERILKELDARDNPLSYNVKNEALGGSFSGEDNGMFGKRHADETKERISQSLSSGIRWGNSKKRIHHSKLMTGENNPMFGVSRKGSWSTEKISLAAQARKENWGFLGGSRTHQNSFRKIFRDLVTNGKFVSPRGQLVIEVENFSYRLPPYVRFCNFECRKLNLDYIKQEFLWYLRGDRFDTSILDHAGMWKNLVNDDGSINSNYGQYVFGERKQFDDALRFLEDDRDTRRASIIILADHHLRMKTKDVPCTYSLNFRIRDNKLNMSVHMRSQDSIYGMGNDAPTFSFIHEMMLCSLQCKYPDLQLGEYFHIADSFHVYEKHFGMLADLTGYDVLNTGVTKREKTRLSSYKMVLCPKISGPEEVKFLRSCEYSNIPENFLFSRWLMKS